MAAGRRSAAKLINIAPSLVRASIATIPMNASLPQARDMDLIRDILLWMERGMPKEGRPSPDNTPRYAYHCYLMVDAGLIDSTVLMDIDRMPCRAHPVKITWKGQEALEVMRNDTVWNKTKAALAERGLPYLLDVVVSVAKGYAVEAGIPLG